MSHIQILFWFASVFCICKIVNKILQILERQFCPEQPGRMMMLATMMIVQSGDAASLYSPDSDV